MIDLGTVRPGSTIRIPFSTFDKDDGSSITMTNFAAADVLVYKDGSTTERASTAGFTATTDFDSKTGKHLIVIDLADDTTADFWKAGSEYLVAIDAVTVDTVTVGGWVARFRIGYAGALFDTSIATLASQTSFTLTAGPAEDNALVGMRAIIHDKASAVQMAAVEINAYTGSTKTVGLAAGATFTVAAGDNISIMGLSALRPTTVGRTLDVSSGGEAGMDWANVGSPTTSQTLSGTTVGTVTTLTNAPSDSSGVTTLLSRIPSGLFTGITSLAQWLGAMAGKQTGNSTARTEIRATGAGSGTFDETTDSQEAIRDNMGTAQTGDSYARLGAPAGASVSADVAAVKAQTAAIEVDTQDLQSRTPAALVGGRMASDVGSISGDSVAADNLEAAADGTGYNLGGGSVVAASVTGNVGGNVTGSIGSLATQAKADVNAEADAALVDIHLDHLLATDYDPASKPGTATALLNELVESDAGVSRFTANALEQGPSGGGGIADWTSDERTAIRSILGIPASGTTPDDPTTGILDTIRDRAVAVEVDTQDIQSRLPAALVGGRIDSSVGAMAANVLTASAIAADAITDAKVASDVTIASVTGAVGSVTGNVGGNVVGSIGSLATQAKADVNAEADTALADYGALKPTTAGRTLDVSAGGEAGIDWANVGSPSTTVALSGTTVKTATDVEADTQDIQGRLPSALVGGRIDATVDATGMEAGAINAILDDTIGDGTLTVRQALRVLIAASAGKLSGAATTTITIRNAADSANVIVATVDADGNRSAVTVTP